MDVCRCVLQFDVYCWSPNCNKQAFLRGHTFRTWNQQSRIACVRASPEMANIGTSFLALNTRRLAVARKDAAAALLLSFNVDMMTAHTKSRS